MEDLISRILEINLAYVVANITPIVIPSIFEEIHQRWRFRMIPTQYETVPVPYKCGIFIYKKLNTSNVAEIVFLVFVYEYVSKGKSILPPT